MPIKLGVIMDPINSIHIEKDSTFAMLLAAQARQWEIYYFEQHDLFVRDGKSFGQARMLQVQDEAGHWFDFLCAKIMPLAELDVILMRKDPPFDQEYIYTTYLLELAEREGVLVVNKPQSLRDANEKFFTTHFPQCTPATLITRDIKLLHEFFLQQENIVCKPLDGMGGSAVFHLEYPDENASVVFEVLTQNGTRFVMAQMYLPAIKEGDKRILLINGEPISHALARIPAPNELRGNLVRGASGEARLLTERDKWICKEVGSVLREKGLYFVGLDVIGDYLTEINVTSPTCIRQLDQQCDLDIAGELMDFITEKLSHS